MLRRGRGEAPCEGDDHSGVRLAVVAIERGVRATDNGQINPFVLPMLADHGVAVATQTSGHLFLGGLYLADAGGGGWEARDWGPYGDSAATATEPDASCAGLDRGPAPLWSANPPLDLSRLLASANCTPWPIRMNAGKL